MRYISPEGFLLDSNKIPILKFSRAFKKLSPPNPLTLVSAVSEIVKTIATYSWTGVTGATGYTVELSTNSDYSAPTTYNVTGQILELTGLTENTRYYIRAKATTPTGDTPWHSCNFKTFWTPVAATLGGNRVATLSDTSLDPHINEGDYLIVGSDSFPDGSRWGVGVSYGGYDYGGIGGAYGLTIPALAPGKKVCILGGRGYDYIALDMVNNPGTSSEKVVITNVGGQVRGKLYLNNFTHVRLTGKYDPVDKTGHSEFLGFDGDWSNLNASFGFYCQGEWSNRDMILSHVGGDTSYSIIEYIETGEGGYSGMTVKNDNGTVPMNGMVMHDCYTHDTGSGEGYYIGSTQNPPQMPVIGFEMYNNVVVRAALNGIQIGNMKGVNALHNNVVVNSGYRWNDAFMNFQDQAIQFNARENGFSFTGNIVAGTAGGFLNWFMFPETVDSPSTGQTTTVSNNVFTDSKTWKGGYVSPRNSFQGTVNMSDNYIGNFGFTKGLTAYTQIYNNISKFDKVLELADSNGTMTMNATNNTYDSTVNSSGFGFCGTNDLGFTVNQTGNTRLAGTIQRPQFNNFMDGLLDDDYSNGEEWVSDQCPRWVDGYEPVRQGTKFEDIKNANLTTCSSSIAIPTTHPTVIITTIGTGKRFLPGEKLVFTSGGNSFTASIVSYNSSTGSVELNSTANSGTGFLNSWSVALQLGSIKIKRVYNLGDIVRYNGRFYQSLHDDNSGNIPSSTGDAHWKLIIWSNGSTRPPDDVRIASDSFYGQKGMGLTYTV